MSAADPTRSPIVISSAVPEEKLGRLVERLKETFERPCRVGDADDLPLPDTEWVETRAILDVLAKRLQPEGAAWQLAIVTHDLRPTGKDSWAFGEAMVGGRCAVVSTSRLAEGDRPLQDRLVGECLHELGHAAGLDHCDRADCVMRQARTLAEVDRRSSSFCPGCAAALRALDNGRSA